MAPRTDFPPIRACLFDMDGLLIDSEDIYTRCINQVLHEYGRPGIPWSIKAQLQGRPASVSHKIFFDWAQLPISAEEYNAQIQAAYLANFPTTQPLPGVETLIQTLSSSTNPRVHIALATSTHVGNFKAKTTHLQRLFSLFPKDQIVLGDDPRIPFGRGKPSPEIFLLALESINETIAKEGKGEAPVKPEECLVFEDSVPGVEAGRRGGMRVVWVPHEGLLGEFTGKEKEVLAGVTPWYSDDPNGKASLGGKPGEIDDGWGLQLKTLENFPYSYYGINTEKK